VILHATAKSRQAHADRSKIAQATRMLLTCDLGTRELGERIMLKAIKTLAVATVVAASASVAFAQSPPPGSYGGPPPASYGAYYPSFPIAPYGYAEPSYSGYYGTYPAHSWDPDPYLRARLRSEFNLAVDGAPK
jgi:hypothetical protein